MAHGGTTPVTKSAPTTSTGGAAQNSEEARSNWQQWSGTVFTNAKAGMAGVDKDKIKAVVYEMSKVSSSDCGYGRSQSRSCNRISCKTDTVPCMSEGISTLQKRGAQASADCGAHTQDAGSGEGPEHFKNSRTYEVIINYNCFVRLTSLTYCNDRGANKAQNGEEACCLNRAMDAKLAKLKAEMDMTRTWMHVDMDAFFAAVEELDEPSLVCLPLTPHDCMCSGIGKFSTVDDQCGYIPFICFAERKANGSGRHWNDLHSQL